MVLELRVGDVLRMRRKHPCGSVDWDVVRVGADIGLVCRGCQRRVLMRRDVLRRRVRAMLDRGAPVDPAVWRALEGDGPATQPAVTDPDEDAP
jgi:hypothetical protein